LLPCLRQTCQSLLREPDAFLLGYVAARIASTASLKIPHESRYWSGIHSIAGEAFQVVQRLANSLAAEAVKDQKRTTSNFR